MKILQICHKSPYPPKEGGPIAVNNITEGLINTNNFVKIITVSTPKYPVIIDKIPEEYILKTQFEYVYIDTLVKPLDAFYNLFSSKSYNIERFISVDMKIKLEEILINNCFDIVQLESLFVTPYIDIIRKFSKAKILLRSHNIEYLIWERLANEAKNPLKKQYLKLLAGRLKKYELRVLSKIDGIATISQNDENIYRHETSDLVGFKKQRGQKPQQLKICTIPFGIDVDKYKPLNRLSDFPSLFFIGSMDWLPNIEGLKWFLKNVWTEINKLKPELKFYIAGRNMPKELLGFPDLAGFTNLRGFNNIIVLGDVPDAIDFINSKSIMIVPLFSGSGIRVKIIEAMALGKPIISTTIGAEGINYSNKKHLLIANTHLEFINAILLYCCDKNYCQEVGENARNLVESEYNNNIIIYKLLSYYKDLQQS